mmetsp:Transcript_51130/g.157685  ORF Transcript_51130/g.157685 Transcript_51130/m.157685 type:complete len:218 (+) Transcript_51130:382-1035(+)
MLVSERRLEPRRSSASAASSGGWITTLPRMRIVPLAPSPVPLAPRREAVSCDAPRESCSRRAGRDTGRDPVRLFPALESPPAGPWRQQRSHSLSCSAAASRDCGRDHAIDPRLVGRDSACSTKSGFGGGTYFGVHVRRRRASSRSASRRWPCSRICAPSSPRGWTSIMCSPSSAVHGSFFAPGTGSVLTTSRATRFARLSVMPTAMKTHWIGKRLST